MKYAMRTLYYYYTHVAAELKIWEPRPQLPGWGGGQQISKSLRSQKAASGGAAVHVVVRRTRKYWRGARSKLRTKFALLRHRQQSTMHSSRV